MAGVGVGGQLPSTFDFLIDPANSSVYYGSGIEGVVTPGLAKPAGLFLLLLLTFFAAVVQFRRRPMRAAPAFQS
jgi:hypothetical protein